MSVLLASFNSMGDNVSKKEILFEWSKIANILLVIFCKYLFVILRSLAVAYSGVRSKLFSAAIGPRCGRRAKR